MPIPPEALELENRSCGDNWEPTLSAAYAVLKEQWETGDRDRELGLHLMFISWYGMIELKHITGFEESIDTFHALEKMFEEVHSFFEPGINDDAEKLYVVGLVTHMQWFMFSNREKWEAISIEYRKAYRSLAPEGIEPTIFDDRGAYGDYFGRHARLKDAYWLQQLSRKFPSHKRRFKASKIALFVKINISCASLGGLSCLTRWRDDSNDFLSLTTLTMRNSMVWDVFIVRRCCWVF